MSVGAFDVRTEVIDWMLGLTPTERLRVLMQATRSAALDRHRGVGTLSIMALTDDHAHDANGVDRTLIRKMLELTPAERARSHDQLLAEVQRLAAAGEVARDRRTPPR